MIKNLAIGGGSNRLLLLLALVFGALCAALVGVYLSSLDSDKAGVSATTIPVVVAAEEIAPLTEITAEMLTVRELPIDLALTGAFEEVEPVVGQMAVASIVPGEQILQTKVTSPESAAINFGADTPLSLIIPEGMRAFTVQVSATGAAGGLVRPGDHVDLIFSGDLEGVEGESDEEFTPASACYVAQNVEVLAWDAGLKRTTAEGDAAGLAAAGSNADASRATLAVSPDQAWQLAAVQHGVSGNGVDKQLWASLRGFGDSTVGDGLPACAVVSGQNLVPGS